MSNRRPSEVDQVTGTSTYTGEHYLYWMTVHATAASVVTISDGATEKLSIGTPINTTDHLIFQPGIHCKTSIVVTLVSGTADITVCYTGG